MYKVGDYVEITVNRPLDTPLLIGDRVKITHVGDAILTIKDKTGMIYFLFKDQVKPIFTYGPPPLPRYKLSDVVQHDPTVLFYFKPFAFSENLGLCWKNDKFPNGFGPFLDMQEALIHYMEANRPEDNVIKVNFNIKKRI